MRRWLPLMLQAAVLLGLAGALWFGTPGSAKKINHEIHVRCLQEQANRVALRKIILRGRDVGKPGSPGFAYYHAHPREARKALQRVNEALDDLPPIHC